MNENCADCASIAFVVCQELTHQHESRMREKIIFFPFTESCKLSLTCPKEPCESLSKQLLLFFCWQDAC